MEEKKKRKTTTSPEVKARWNKKTYNTYSVKLRKTEDADIISYIEKMKENGIGTTEIFRQALIEAMNH